MPHPSTVASWRSSQLRRVVIVGGGAAGVLASAALLRGADPAYPIDVRLVERDELFGPGLAYGAADPHHVLNNTANRMSAFADDPEHVIRWCQAHGIRADRGSYLPRRTYGRYLAGVLASLEDGPGGRLIRVRGEAVRVVDEGTEARVDLSCGWSMHADAVVLALGNPPPRPQPVPGLELGGTRFVADPWTEDALGDVTGADRVLMLGTGLTMVDVATTLARRHPRLTMVATSRHALLPQPHSRAPYSVGAGLRPTPEGLRGLVRQVIQQVREAERSGGDWRGVVDGVRPQIGDLWTALSYEDRERFLRHLARRWETHRHRMAPDVADEVAALCASGRLQIRAGIDDLSSFTRVVNCTGPRSVASAGWSALVDALLADGTARPDPLGLGFDLDAHGGLVGADGDSSSRLFALGAARRGARWEAAAVPEIREHAAELARAFGAVGVPPTRAAAPVSGA